MVSETIVDIELSMSFDGVLEELVHQFNSKGSSINLGSGLPDIFSSPRLMRKAWGQVLDGDKGIAAQLRTMLSNFNLPKAVSKQLLTWPVSKQAGILCKLLLVPQLRCYKHGNDSKLTVSELMMARLMQFPEYSDLSIDKATDFVCESLVIQRFELFNGVMNSISQLACSVYYDPRDVARMVRLSRLDSQIRSIEDLPAEQKYDLLAGIFGLFDSSGLSLFFCLFLDDYEHLRPYFSNNTYAKRASEAKSDGMYEKFLIDLLIRDITDTEVYKTSSITYHIRTLGGFAPFLKWHAAASAEQLQYVNKELQDNLALAKLHVSSLVETDAVQPVVEPSVLNAFILSEAFIECSVISNRLGSILDHPFIVSLANKDKEKEALVEELRSLDHSNPENAIRLADKIKALCQTVDHAPDELIHEIETLKAQVSRYNELFASKIGAVVMATDSSQEQATSHVESDEHIEVLRKLEAAVGREDALNEELKKTKGRVDALEQKLAEQRTLNATLKRSAHSATVAPVKPVVEGSVQVGDLVGFVTKNAVRTPEDMLRLLAIAYPERVEILDSAYESARGAASYRHVTKLGGVLFTLVTDYLEAIQGGEPDSTARNLLGDTLRARESDGVLGSPRLRALREFTYDGSKRLFVKHLAFGNKPGVNFSVRVYFEIIDSKVVIAYCGEHLETISSS